MTEKSLRIRINDDELYDFIVKKPNYSEYLRDLVNADRTGKVLDTESLEFRKKKADVRIKEATAIIKEHEAKYLKNFGTAPTPKGKEAIKTYANSNVIDRELPPKEESTYTPPEDETEKSPYDKDNDRLQCIDCGILFTWTNDTEKSKAKEDYVNHKFKKHDGNVTQIEQEILKIV